MWFLICLFASLMIPEVLNAQTILPRNDVTLSLGWSGAEHDATSDYDRWGASLAVGVRGSHYWTDHVKTEIEAAWNTPTNHDIYEEIVIRGARTHAWTNYRFADVRLSLGQSYQFGRNKWIHPSIGAGADLIRRDIETDRMAQTRPTYGARGQRPTDVHVPSEQENRTVAIVRPYVKGGWKLYATDRLFFSTDVKLAFADDLDHMVWNLGMGFDF